MNFMKIIFASILLTFGFTANAEKIPTYKFELLGTPPVGFASAQAYSVNSKGLVTGVLINQDYTSVHAFSWTKKNGYVVRAKGFYPKKTNESGDTVGWLVDDQGSGGAAIMDKNGNVTVLFPGSTEPSYGISINDKGEVVGLMSGLKNGTPCIYGFYWNKGEMYLLGNLDDHINVNVYDINNAGQIIGDVSGGFIEGHVTTSVRWKNYKSMPEKIFNGPDSPYMSMATAINNSGDVVGITIDDFGIGTPYLRMKRGKIVYVSLDRNVRTGGVNCNGISGAGVAVCNGAAEGSDSLAFTVSRDGVVSGLDHIYSNERFGMAIPIGMSVNGVIVGSVRTSDGVNNGVMEAGRWVPVADGDDEDEDD